MSTTRHKKNFLRWYDHLLLHIIPPIAALAIKGLMLSCRVVSIRGKKLEEEALAKSGGGAVYATWHQRMSYHFHYFGSRHVTMMISKSRDGEYAARMAKWLGFRNVRGSSTRGGRQALREMIRRVRAGEIGGMLADGPLGPPRVAKIGSIVIAKDAKVPLVPVLWGADRCWVLNTWDRYMIPKPFSKIAICYGEPIWIPENARGEALENYRKLFEDRMNNAAKWCDDYFGVQRPWKKKKANIANGQEAGNNN